MMIGQEVLYLIVNLTHTLYPYYLSCHYYNRYLHFSHVNCTNNNLLLTLWLCLKCPPLFEEFGYLPASIDYSSGMVIVALLITFIFTKKQLIKIMKQTRFNISLCFQLFFFFFYLNATAAFSCQMMNFYLSGSIMWNPGYILFSQLCLQFSIQDLFVSQDFFFFVFIKTKSLNIIGIMFFMFMNE